MKIVSNLFWRRSGTEGFLGQQKLPGAEGHLPPVP